MATGDLRANLERALLEASRLRYSGPIDLESLKAGDTAALLPLLHHALYGYSSALATHVVSKGYELMAKSDKRFVEGLLRLARDEFGLRSPLSSEQFLSTGFAERKLIFAADFFRACRAKNADLSLPTAVQAPAPLAAAAVPRPRTAHRPPIVPVPSGPPRPSSSSSSSHVVGSVSGVLQCPPQGQVRVERFSAGQRVRGILE
eukprot:m51a1_g13930 hypothetical protein (203) ;mRNA; r:844045-844928